MISISVIDKTLQKNFSKTIRDRGEAYHRLGMVSYVRTEGSLIEAEVLGSDSKPYKVSFELNDYYRILEGDCTCPYEEECKHQAAVLFALKKELIESPQKSSFEPSIQSSRRTLKRSRPSVRKTAIKKLEMENIGAKQYRMLPIQRNFLASIEQLFPPRMKGLSWHENFEVSFLSSSHVEIYTVNAYAHFRHNEQRISLKHENGKVWVKCHECNRKSKTLCQHQGALLSKVGTRLEQIGFLEGKFDYKKLLGQSFEQLSVTEETFEKYFKIILNMRGFAAVPKVDNFRGASWLEETQSLLEGAKEERSKALKDLEFRLEEGRTKKYAFFWGKETDYYNRKSNNAMVTVSFIQGNGFKTKEGIHGTNRETTGMPDGFPEPFHSLGRELFFLMQKKQSDAQFTAIQNWILNNHETLNEIYHYVSDEDPMEGKVRASDMQLFKFHPSIIQCRFTIRKKDGLIEFQRHLSLDGKPFKFSRLEYSHTYFGTDRSNAYLYPNARFEEFMQLFEEHDTLLMPFTNQQNYTKLVKGLQTYFDVDADDDLMLKEVVLTDPEFQILLRELGSFVLFEPRLKYGEYSFNAFNENDYSIEETLFRPDESDRQFLVEFLKNAHTDFEDTFEVQDYVFLDMKAMINDYWFMHFNEACEAAGVELLGVKDLTKFKYSKHKASTYSHVKSGIDWFEVDMKLSFGNEVVKTADWIKALRNKESYVRLKDGSLGVLPEEWLEHARQVLAVADVEKGKLKISKYRFNIIDTLFEDIDDKKIIKELQAKKRRLAEIELNKTYPIPNIVTAELRDYQEQGFQWLKFLDESGFGGILADDMGLGKTLQVITLLADQIDNGVSLVIVPRSLLFNWAAELDKFCPSLTYTIHHGQGRIKDIQKLLEHNVIITTYGTAAIDIEMFQQHRFNYIILDESQAIKNPESKRYKAMRLLQAKNRIAMTGTPIENNTFDLYAQLSFTSPGLLGTKTGFKNSFAIPIDNNGDVEAASLLRKLVHPFLLRRTKEQVAKDLPEKTESIIYCEMGATQRKLYNNLKRKIKEDIEAEVEEKGIAQSKFKLLDGLLRLRQMCNSPLLINNGFKGTQAESVKINILLQNLTEELDNHSALIFSQFVSLLTIVRKELDKRGIKYAYLDGSTAKRQAEVDKFMQTDDIKIFLISLKAGNTGMNLTKADYVYILDPWWNPAVEAQAIDRTHRIGQDKQIFAYKLICKDSIEEKILKLQQKKRNLADDIIRTDENVLKSLEKDELLALFD